MTKKKVVEKAVTLVVPEKSRIEKAVDEFTAAIREEMAKEILSDTQDALNTAEDSKSSAESAAGEIDDTISYLENIIDVAKKYVGKND
jgi:hypothetical protein